MLVSRISQPMALAASTANSTACLLSTGRAPGRPRQMGQTWVLGSPPYSFLQPQKALERVRSWTWTSRPITGWYLARTSGESARAAGIELILSTWGCGAGLVDRLGLHDSSLRPRADGGSGALGSL